MESGSQHGCSVGRCRIPIRLPAPDTRPIEPGEVWVNPVTLERAVIVEVPWLSEVGRVVADVTALPGARVAGEHLHPALHESFSVKEGELTVLRDGQQSVLRAGDRADIEPASGTIGGTRQMWTRSCARRSGRVSFRPHDRNAVRARPRRTREQAWDAAPTPAGALRDRVFGRDVFRKPPAAVQRVVCRRAHADRPPRGHRATYPTLSRTTLARARPATLRTLNARAR